MCLIQSQALYHGGDKLALGDQVALGDDLHGGDELALGDQVALNITRPRQRMLFTGTVGERGKLVEYHLTVLGMVGAEMIRQARGHLLLNTGWSGVNII